MRPSRAAQPALKPPSPIRAPSLPSYLGRLQARRAPEMPRDPPESGGRVLQNKLTRAQYLDEVTWTTKNWLGLQKQRISVVLHTAIAEQVVNELACGGGGRVHGAKCLATLAGVA